MAERRTPDAATRRPGRRRGWRRGLRRLTAGVAMLVALLLVPVGYVEIACRGTADTGAPAYEPLLGDAAARRREANTYLTYPEWHIVYAYDGLAAALARGDEHAVRFTSDIAGFWRSTCALMRVADGHGGADAGTRAMIHTIGVSFTLEWVVKGLYEETVGRVTAWLRGPAKSPQDVAVAAMARDYAAFLRQTPWYAYPFLRAARDVWTPPAGFSVRAWERRLGIGLEFSAKAVYGALMGWAVAATEPAILQIRSVVTGIDRTRLEALPDVRIVGARAGGFEIETPRYDRFTRLLAAIAAAGGTIVEIAGNDDVMVTLTAPPGAEPSLAHGTLLARLGRSGIAGERWLVDVKVRDLAALVAAHPLGDPGLEHVFDY